MYCLLWVKRLKPYLPFLLLISFLIIYFGDFLLLRGMFFSSDLRSNEFQLRVYVGKVLHQGKFPLWVPELFCGYPLLGDYMAGLYYPLNLVLFYFLPDYAAFNYFILIHYFLLTIFVFIYARLIGISPLGALVSSLIYTYGGHCIVRTGQTTHLVAMTSMPIVITLLELSFKRKKNLYLWLAGIVSGLSIFNGHPKLIGFTMLFAAIYILARDRMDKQPESIFTLPYLKRNIGKIILFIGIACGIGAIQLIPFIEQQQFSYRAQPDTYEHATYGSLNWQGLLTLVFPFIYGGPYEHPDLYAIFFETCIYLGIVSLFLIAIAVVGKKKKNYVHFFVWTIMLTLLLALGNHTPLYRLVFPFPLFNRTRVPAKILFITSFAAAILAGIGIDGLSGFFSRLRKAGIIRFLFRESLILFGIGLFLTGTILITHSELRKLLVLSLSGKNFILANALWQCGLIGLVIVTFLFWLRYHVLSIKKLKYLLIGFLIVDLFWFGNILKQDLNRAVNLQLCLSEPAAAKAIKQDQSVFRVYSLSNQLYEGYEDIYDSISLLTRFSGLYYQIPTFHLYGPSHILRYYELLGNIEAPWVPMSPQARATALYQKISILSIANVKYIITHIPLNNERLELVRNGDVKVYRIKPFLPRAFFISEGVSLQKKQEILEFLNQPNFDPTKIVVLEKFPDSILLKPKNLKSPAEIVRYYETLHRILLKTVSSDSGFLFLSKYYYPGWHAYIDGKETQIYPANYLFNAILLPPGTHIITFIFRPISFYIGGSITIITLLTFIYNIISPLYKKHLVKRCPKID